MTTNQFIEKAIEGGWKNPYETAHRIAKAACPSFPDDLSELTLSTILLDPEAWKAVGEVEGCPNCLGHGWTAEHDSMSTHNPETGECESCPVQVPCNCTEWDWRANMHRMIDALADGKSIEEFLATL